MNRTIKSETEPVTPDEFVIRLIWHFNYTVGMPLPISYKAFAPKKDEIDGISVFRAACIADPVDVLAVIDPDKRNLYCVALLNVGDIENLGLSVQSAPIDRISGHAVLPELNIVSRKADPKLAEIQKELAILANKYIVRVPVV